jgi:hypothetical protein
MLPKLKKYVEEFWRTYVLFLAPILFLPVLFSGMNGDFDLNNGNDTKKAFDVNVPGRKSDYEPMACAYILLVMAIYW